MYYVSQSVIIVININVIYTTQYSYDQCSPYVHTTYRILVLVAGKVINIC